MEGENTILDGTVSGGAAQTAEPVITPEVVSVAPPPIMPEVVATASPVAAPEVVSVSAPVITPAGEVINVDATPVAEPVVEAAPVFEAAPEAVAPVAEPVVAAETVAAAPVVETVEAVAAAPVVEAVEATAEAAPAAEPTVFQVQSQSDYFAEAFRYEPVTPEAAQPAQSTGTVFTPQSTTTFTPQQSAGTTFTPQSTTTFTPQQSAGTTFTPQSTGTVFTPRQTNDTYGANSNYGSGYGQSNYSANGGYNQSAGGYSNSGYSGYGNSGYGQNSQSGYGQTGQSGFGGNNNNYMQPGYRAASDEYSTPDYFGGVYNNDPFASYYDDEEPKRASNGLAIAALVCGIVSLVTMCSYTGFIPGIIAIILGIKGAAQCENKAMARTGMILGICGVVAGAIFIFAFILRAVDEIYSIF